MARVLTFFFFALSLGCSETGLNKVGPSANGGNGVVMDTGEPAWDEDDDQDSSDEDDPNFEAPPDDENPPTDDPPEDDDTPEDDPPPVDDCDHASDLIYVIDRTDESLYLFDPTDLSFDFVGELDCGIFAGTPGSMSVTREGVAYVRYSDNTVYAVDLETMACTETSYSWDFGGFGMGYATHSDSTWHDRLYIANANQLATVDTSTWAVSVIGSLPSQSELTGNADGELWAILPLESPAKLVQINKTTASVMTTHALPGLPDPSGIDTFAFATWGGDFWVFVRSYGMGSSTNVYRVTGSGAMSLTVSGTGMDIVGAGVSTCAPTD